MKKIQILALILSVLAFFSLLGTCSKDLSFVKDRTGKIDTLKAKTDTIYIKTKDTIKLIGKTKVKIESVFIKEVEKINLKDTTELKKSFNVTYPRENDTTNTFVGYSQIKKTLITDSKYRRDSTLLGLTTTQLSVCTTGLTNLKNKSDSSLDSAKKLIVESYDKGHSDGSKLKIKQVVIGGILFFTLGAVANHYY